MDGQPLTDYERRQIEAIRAWIRQPSPFSVRAIRKTGRAASGAGRWVGRVAAHVLPEGTVEGLHGFVHLARGYARVIVPSGAIEGALHANIWLADRWADQRSVLKSLGAQTFEELKSYDLDALDRVASGVHDWAIAYGGAVGAGAGGILLSVPGIAAAINISLRTIRKIGLCYGYAALDDLEKRFVFSILALGGGGDQLAKLASFKTLRELQIMVARETFKSMAHRAAQGKLSKEALITTMRSTAKQLGFQITRKRILVSIPLISGGVGLFLDGNHIRRVGWDAVRSYQRRWLIDRGRWPDDESALDLPCSPDE